MASVVICDDKLCHNLFKSELKSGDAWGTVHGRIEEAWRKLFREGQSL